MSEHWRQRRRPRAANAGNDTIVDNAEASCVSTAISSNKSNPWSFENEAKDDNNDDHKRGSSKNNNRQRKGELILGGVTSSSSSSSSRRTKLTPLLLIVIALTILFSMVAFFVLDSFSSIQQSSTFFHSYFVKEEDSSSAFPLREATNASKHFQKWITDEEQIQNHNHLCSRWIPNSRGEKSSRSDGSESKVVAPTIVIRTKSGRFQSWEDYMEGNGYLGGEAYWIASLHYALRDLRYHVEFSNHEPFGSPVDIERLEKSEIHRVIVDGAFVKDSNWTTTLTNRPDLMCKVRHTEWWPWNKQQNETHYNEKLKQFYPPYDSKRALSPYTFVKHKLDGFTLLPFFIHSQVTLPPISMEPTPYSDSSSSNPPHVLLLDKQCRFSSRIIQGLIDDGGFILHVTCFSNQAKYNLVSSVPSEYLSQIKKHSRMTPLEFSKLLRYNITMVVGFGQPKSSPTPYEAIANGATFLHPTTVITDRTTTTNGKVTTISKDPQHKPLISSVGEPYVYNYEYVKDDVNRTTLNILEAAKLAVTHRFVSFIPKEHQLSQVQRQLCQNLIHDNRPCRGGNHDLLRKSPKM